MRALRERFGDEVELYVDGNRGWTAAESLRAMKEMADLGLSFAEELCPADDVLGRRWLVGKLDVPFVADESVPTPADVTREVLGGSATAVSIKTARTGFTGSQRVHHLAEGLGLEVILGNQIDGQVGTACAVAFGAAYPLVARRAGELSNFLDMSDDLLAEPLRDPRWRATRAVRRRTGHRTRPRQADPLPHRWVRPPNPTTPPGQPQDATNEGEPDMTTMHNPVEEATAAASGALATERFHADKSPFEAVKDTAPERVDELAREVLQPCTTPSAATR